MPDCPFSFRHVEEFHAVMTTGTGTAAAAMLHTSQPPISRELARFELVTGLTLLSRMGGKRRAGTSKQGAIHLQEHMHEWLTAYRHLQRQAGTREPPILRDSGGN